MVWLSCLLSEAQEDARAGSFNDYESDEISADAQRLLRRAVGLAMEPALRPAAAVQQPEPDAKQAQVPLHGSRPKGPPVLNMESLAGHSADSGEEEQMLAICRAFPVASTSSPQGSGAARDVGGGSGRPASAAATDCSKRLDDSGKADVTATGSISVVTSKILSSGQLQSAASLLPSDVAMQPGAEQTSAVPATSFARESAADAPVEHLLTPSAGARTGQNPAQPAEAAQQQLAVGHNVCGAGRKHLAHGPRAHGLPAEGAPHFVALECLLLLFVVRCRLT